MAEFRKTPGGAEGIRDLSQRRVSHFQDSAQDAAEAGKADIAEANARSRLRRVCEHSFFAGRCFSRRSCAAALPRDGSFTHSRKAKHWSWCEAAGTYFGT